MSFKGGNWLSIVTRVTGGRSRFETVFIILVYLCIIIQACIGVASVEVQNVTRRISVGRIIIHRWESRRLRPLCN